MDFQICIGYAKDVTGCDLGDVFLAQEVDVAGIRVAGCSGAAYVLWLERHLKNASLGCKRQGGLEVQRLGSRLVAEAQKGHCTDYLFVWGTVHERCGLSSVCNDESIVPNREQECPPLGYKTL